MTGNFLHRLISISGICLSLFLISVPNIIWAGEIHIRGRVFDLRTREPLAFVNILIENTQTGTMSDMDGNFSITHHEPFEKLKLSAVGYYGKVYEIDPNKKVQNIMMQKRVIELPVVEVFPGENPAHRIIENAIAARNLNNPENLSSFSYESYNRFIFTGRFDEQQENQQPSTDTIHALEDLRKYLQQRHFMIMETVTQRNFRYPSLNTETILASRTAGFRDQTLALMASRFQSFSFYGDYIALAENEYLSPLSPGSTNRYFFLLEDTTFVQNDTVFIISFRPGRGRHFDGLKGVLYINSNGWALQNVIAEPAVQPSALRIRIQQVYELIDGRRWFPTQLNTDLEIEVDPEHGLYFIGEGRSYLQNIRIEPLLRRRDFSSFTYEFAPDTIRNKNDFWNRHRTDTLGIRELNTYVYIDSLGQTYNFDRRLEGIASLLRGRWRLSVFDLEIRQFLRFNDHQGFIPGLGFRTNRHFSRIFGFNARIAYGLKNQSLTYGLGAEKLLDRLSDFRIGHDFRMDFEEPGTVEFLERPGLLSPTGIRSFFLQNLDLVEGHTSWLRFRAFRNNLSVKGYVADEDHQIRTSYAFVPDIHNPHAEDNRFRFFETGLRLRLGFGERYIRTPTATLATGSDFQAVSLNLSRGWRGVLNGQYDYWRAGLRIENRFRIKMAGVQHWVFQAGYVHGQPPWPKLFTAQASYRPIAIATPQSFATMRMSEFISDRYLQLFFYHYFENLLFGRPGFSPGVAFLTNIGFGSLKNPQAHQGLPFRVMNRGFFESGIAITNLFGEGLTSMGLEFIFRYGPYALPRFIDNISIRLTYAFIREQL